MTTLKKIQTDQAPRAIGCYSQGICWENLGFLSGQIGMDPQTLELVGDDCASQLQQIFKNMSALLSSLGADFTRIVKLTVFMTDLKEYGLLNELMQQYFQPPYPARSVVQVVALPKKAVIEIEAIVAL